MGRPARSLIALIPLALGVGCGDPIVVLGDAPGIARVIAGIGDSIGSRVDSLATRSRLTEPSGIAFDDAGQLLYLTDRGASLTQGGVTRRVGRVFSIRSDGRLSLRVDRGGCAAAVCLESPHSLALAPGGDLFLSDVVGHRIFRLRPGSNVLDVIAGTGAAGSTADGALAAGAALNAPAGIAWVGGRLLFAEQGAHRVRSIEPDGRLATVAGTGLPGSDGDGGPAASARLDAPAGLASADGILFIADRGSHRVRRVDLASGVIATVAGNGAAGFGGDGGAATAAGFNRPSSVAVTNDGATLFIADQGNDRVRAVDLRSGVVVTFAGTGDPAFVAGPRPAGAISVRSPAGLAVSASGFLFIADAGHSVVWRATLRF